MKNIITICLLAMAPLQLWPQLAGFSLQSPNQEMVEDAITGGMVIVEQAYQLEDTVSHQLFGRYGNNEFGQSYSVAVKVPGGLLVQDCTARPWEYDPNFDRYRESHRPALYTTRYRELTDSAMTTLAGDIRGAEPSAPGLYMVTDSTTFGGNGFMADCATGDECDGWLAWVVSPQPIDSCGSQSAQPSVSYTIYRHKLALSPDSSEYTVKTPQVTGEVWGGIYIVPRQTGIGQITFTLCGVMVQGEEGTWKIAIPKRRNEEIKEAPKGDELTPTGSSKDDKDEKNKKKNKK